MTHLHIDESLTPLQVKIYGAIREAWVDWGMSPSQVEIRNATLCSITTVMQALKILRAKGYISQVKFQARSLRPTDPDRVIANHPVYPWEELVPAQKFFLPPTERLTNR